MDASASAADDDLRQLGQLLWRYREQLEQLEFLLDVQRLLVANGRDRWLGRVVDQLDVAALELDVLEQQRAEVLHRVTARLGLPGQASLRDLVAHSPEPWADLLADHLVWFTREVARIAEVAQQARAVVGEGLAGVQDLLRNLKGGGGTGYGHDGRPVAHIAGGSLFFDDRA
jgi:hypothetical protein